MTLWLTSRLNAGAELVKNKINWSERRVHWRRAHCTEQGMERNLADGRSVYVLWGKNWWLT